jgi:serine/threonine protein kinase
MNHFSINDIILNNYRIEKSIGQGAFGEVFLATHTGLNGKRAIKVLLRDEAGLGSSDYDEYRNRFRQESQLMEWFNHPNIIRVYDFLEVDKTLYLIMEFAAGGSLKQKLDDHQKSGSHFSLDKTVTIGMDIAEGLALLHGKDIVHRDLKPSNILFDATGKAKISDFGLAQIPGGGSVRSQLSIPKPHPGTPVYMSPEQETAGSYLRPSSDVYSLGLIFFEMLTGRSFKNVRPGTPINSLVPEMPDWFNSLLQKMLADSPKERLWDGSDVVNALRLGSTGHPIERKVAKESHQQDQDHILEQPETVIETHELNIEEYHESVKKPTPIKRDRNEKEIQEFFYHGTTAIELGDYQTANYFASYLDDLGAEEEAQEIRDRIEGANSKKKKIIKVVIVALVIIIFIFWMSNS